MSAVDDYIARMEAIGLSKRSMVHRRASEYFLRHHPESLSYKQMRINGVDRSAMVLSSEGNNIKKIETMPGESLPHGGLVEWENNMWLITELDPDNTLYSKGIMKQCNYILRWLNNDGRIIERWCIVEDGTKYLIGELNKSLMAIGAARISVTIARDADTILLKRGDRFLIDDSETPEPICYEITKPNRFFNVYNGDGVFRFIMTETNRTANDNLELMVCDYYNRERPVIPDETNHGEVSWL